MLILFSQQYTLDADLHSPWFFEVRDRYGRLDVCSLEGCKKLREIAFNTTYVNEPDPEILTVRLVTSGFCLFLLLVSVEPKAGDFRDHQELNATF